MNEVSSDQRRQKIAAAAYLRAERRGFTGGDPVQDWLEAEAEVNAESAQDDLLVRLDQRLESANETLRTLRRRFVGLKAHARDELSEELAKLEKLRDRLQQKAQMLRRDGDQMGEKAKQRAEEAKQQAEKIWQQISIALERLARKRGRVE